MNTNVYSGSIILITSISSMGLITFCSFIFYKMLSNHRMYHVQKYIDGIHQNNTVYKNENMYYVY